MPGARRLPAYNRGQLHPWDCQQGDTLTLSAGTQQAITFTGGISRITIRANGGEVYYAINDALCTPQSPGYIADGGVQTIGPIANLSTLTLLSHTDSTKAHVEICKAPSVASSIAWPPTYMDKVLSYNPILYFPMSEAAGAVAVNYGTLGTAANGAYTGVALANAAGPSGETLVPFFDGANDYLDAYSAALAAAFSGTEGSLMVWGRVANVGVWTDGVLRSVSTVRSGASNYMRIEKNAVNGRRRWIYTANADVDVRDQNGVADTDWACYGLTWSDSGNQAIVYINGAQEGAVLTPIGTWVGALDPNRTLIGADTKAPANVWHGWLSDVALWTSALTPAQFLDLATV